MFDFLKDVVLVDSATKPLSPKARIFSPPEGLVIRVYRSGKYKTNAEVLTLLKGEGSFFDAFSSKDWTPYPKDQQQTVLIGTSDVKTKITGTITAEGTCKDLWEEIVKTWDISDNVRFVDLKIESEYQIRTENNIYHLPKVISRGEGKGQRTTIRRENINLYPTSISIPDIAIERTVVATTAQETNDVVIGTNPEAMPTAVPVLSTDGFPF